MIQSRSFWRKIAYLAAIALLFIPISQLSAPATTRNEGGRLSRMRKELRLSPAELGKIDPAGAAMSLATLGMRGIAANLLWGRAQHYYKTENYDASKAAVNQITKLQPNYVSVWQFLAWQLSYNISVEFDDFRHRYHWVKKGIDYLIEGNRYNENEPLLLWDTGWFFGHKLGRADEHRQFRRLFRDDTDFHPHLPIDMQKVRGPDDKPDNWKVAHEWFNWAVRVVESGSRIKRLSMKYEMEGKQVYDKRNTPISGKNPLIFFSDPPKALINFADAIAKEGYLDERTILAWQKAAEGWAAYGKRDILGTLGFPLQLSALERVKSDLVATEERLDAFDPSARGRIEAEKIAALKPEEKAVFDKPVDQRTPEDHDLFSSLVPRLSVSYMDVAQAAPADKRAEAIELAKKATQLDELLRLTESYREISNYGYWETRCAAEQETEMIAARRFVYDAQKEFAEGDLETAKTLFEQAWDHWAEIFVRYPVLVKDVEGEDVVESVQVYKKVLDQLDLPYPPPGFKLMELVETHKGEYPDVAPPENKSTSEADGDSDTPVDESPAAEETTPAP